ncbi:hypothetical protein HanRHA438_Chr16g0744771 [Helianthus annuus]|uniref:Uncharacterized protein n=1 Tax=Helianthus annuus TaxID=4232 RepID=A0A251RX69_HELAN|nr:hypothetical protein HanXRQr2_Chr16g0732211 [Helianthus annuus]KAJ0441316.1 hypothetical protein HanIR_Chr16g0796361 [Helianthus annuus]KAJ0819963.1 hypothetical protein HanPSC8_Chr16g0702201 [Helianthus annuus]KAJ0834537.1 hypothetical protein HanRHA438_Chr16g0744771 [Helianthus annuus]
MMNSTLVGDRKRATGQVEEDGPVVKIRHGETFEDHMRYLGLSIYTYMYSYFFLLDYKISGRRDRFCCYRMNNLNFYNVAFACLLLLAND